MPEVPAVGLSLSDQAQTIGAIAGFAAILGLAILSLLYFAQARELKRLREWAGRSPERAAEIEQQVAAGAPRRVVTPPGAARPAAATPAGQAVKAPPPGTPARTAAATAAGAAAGAAAATPGAVPATATLGAATPKPATLGAPTPKPATPPVPGAVPVPAATAAATDGDTTVQPVATPAPTGIPPAAAPSGLAAPVAPAPIPGAARPAQPVRAAAGATRSAPATPPGGRRGRDGVRDGTRRPRSKSRVSRTTALVAGAVVLVLIAGVFLATQLGGGSDKKVAAKPNTVGTPVTSTGANGKRTTSSTTAASAPVDKADTTVAVLNGTTVTGLANTVADKVTGAGYKKGAVTNAADQQRSATAVAYAPGHQAEGEAVAKLIGVGADAVAPLDETTAAIAGTNATVVVTVGSDQKPQ